MVALALRSHDFEFDENGMFGAAAAEDASSSRKSTSQIKTRCISELEGIQTKACKTL